jgi:hypothetical protein
MISAIPINPIIFFISEDIFNYDFLKILAAVPYPEFTIAQVNVGGIEAGSSVSAVDPKGLPIAISCVGILREVSVGLIAITVTFVPGAPPGLNTV